MSTPQSEIREEWFRTQEQHNDNVKTFDKAILYLSPATLALIFSALPQLKDSAYLPFIIAPILTSLTALGMNLTSHFYTSRALRLQLNLLGADDGSESSNDYIKALAPYNHKIDMLTWWSGIIYGVGVLFMSIFVILHYHII